MAKTNAKPVEKGIAPKVTYDRAAELIAAWYHADGDGKDATANADKLRQMIREHPDPDSITILSGLVEGALMDGCVRGQGSRIVLDNELDVMRRQFDYDNSSGVERALIDRIVLCWLRLQICERRRAGFDKPGSHIIAHIELAERQLHMAHTRYLRAIEELAKVRFLMSRTNMHRLQAVRDGMKKAERQQEPGKVLEMRAG